MASFAPRRQSGLTRNGAFFPDIALHVPTVLLPRADVELSKWAVIACDQYTSQPGYWAGVRELVGTAPSALNLIFPEADLASGKEDNYIAGLKQNMQSYLKAGILEPCPPGFVAVERRTAYVKSRKGLLVALDLEQYSQEARAKTLIRATEGTVAERISARVKIRERAPIELPHTMVLIDDAEKTVIEPLFEEGLSKLYDFDLMMGGGHVRGYFIGESGLIQKVAKALRRLADPCLFAEKYGLPEDEPVLLYAVGDGNHSLAAAKTLWEAVKQNDPRAASDFKHPARFSLVELVNLHDEGLRFEPIHRLVKNVDVQTILTGMDAYYNRLGALFRLTSCGNPYEVQAEAKRQEKAAAGQAHVFAFCSSMQSGVISIGRPPCNMVVGTLQAFLDDFRRENPEAAVDYIHGAQTAVNLGLGRGAIAFLLPAISKHDLFKAVIHEGAFPKKTFSLGQADEKRFYLEAQRIG